jgi:hypothetical protein
LDQQTVSDYQNLKTLYTETSTLKISPFSTKPYALSTDTLPAFSGQLFRNHVEMNTRYAYWEVTPNITIPLVQPEYFMHDQSKADWFNETADELKYQLLKDNVELFLKTPTSAAIRSLRSQTIRNSDWYSLMRTLQIETIAKLYLLYQTLGQMPKELELSAGDFMADPLRSDYDLKLITLRGGLMEVDDIYEFLLAHTEYDRYEGGVSIGYLPFNEETIELGIAQANNILEEL